MKSSTRVASLFSAMVLAVGLAGCGNGSVAEPMSATPTGSSTPAGDPTTGNPASTIGGEHNDADVAFAQMMTIHHEGALEMSKVAVEEAASQDVRDLATRIAAAQLPEIELMQSWLASWDEPLSPEGHAGMDHGGMDMGGMSQEQVMAELGQASGTAFDAQFLSAMVAHHEGAVMMAEAELDEGENSDALDLAQRIIDAQQVEIAEMEQLLER